MMISKLSSAAPTVAASVVERSAMRPDKFVPDVVIRAVSQAPPMLREMALPDEYVRLIQPGLKELRFSVEYDRLIQTIAQEATEFRFTVVRNGIRRSLVLLENEVLTIPSRENKVALTEVRELFLEQSEFQREKRLYVFHDRNPHCAFKAWMEKEWRENRGIQLKFIPLTELTDLREMPLTHQTDYLKLTLDLAATPAGPAGKPALSDMTFEDKCKLVNILVHLPDFDEGKRGRSALIEQHNELREFARNFNFEGAPGTVAKELINKLLEQGRLGALFKLMEAQNLTSEDSDVIKAIREHYAFAEGAPGTGPSKTPGLGGR